jgi:hypothetical protein
VKVCLPVVLRRCWSLVGGPRSLLLLGGNGMRMVSLSGPFSWGGVLALATVVVAAVVGAGLSPFCGVVGPPALGFELILRV